MTSKQKLLAVENNAAFKGRESYTQAKRRQEETHRGLELKTVSVTYVQSSVCNVPTHCSGGSTGSKEEYNQHSAITVPHFLPFIFKLVYLAFFDV